MNLKERLIYIASTLVFVAGCFYFRIKFQESQQNYEAAKIENGRMAVLLENETYNMQTAQKEIVLLKDKSYTKYVLSPNESGSTGLSMTVYQSKIDGQVYAIVSTPFSLDRTLQYQLWGLKDGQYLNAGTFQVGLTGLQKMYVLPLMDSFTVTIEPMGKAEKPSTAPVVKTEEVG